MRSLFLSSLSSLTLLGGCFVIVGEIPEGSDTGSGGDASSMGGSAGAGATGGAAGVSGGGGQAGLDGAAGMDGASGSAGRAGSGGAAGQDGGTDSGGSGGTAGCCDCDGDQQAGLQCLGEDCADDDNMVFKGQGGWFSVPNKAGTFDYNCSGVPEKEFGITNCGTLGAITACNQQPVGYYDSSKGCGETVTLGKCIWMTLSCQQSVVENGHTIRCH